MKIENEQILRPPLQDFCRDTMLEKYAAFPHEQDAAAIHLRVSRALGRDDAQRQYFFDLFEEGLSPAGRINRAAGSDTNATMINCFVQPIADTMSGHDASGVPGIMTALSQAAETMRRGGGVGYDFSPIRPRGALVKGTNSRASGPVSYMRVFDRMCGTVESAGARRGAQMGILRIDHPDIEEFVDAKRTPDFEKMGLAPREVASLLALVQSKPGFGWEFRRAFATLSNFNISVAVTDEFMEAVAADRGFDLVHEAVPEGGRKGEGQKVCADGKLRYIYRTVRARDLWERILRNTFDGGDPGIIFIDRVNRMNNLAYCETIHASNPCSEQFLPPFGCCDLASNMLQACVVAPFTAQARFDWDKYRRLVRGGVVMLDRVLDVTIWPLPEQQDEAMAKRRIGLGYLGLADALAMLGLKYDSDEARRFAAQVTAVMRDEAYAQSVELAKELGPFPLFDAEQYLRKGTFASTLPQALQDAIRTHGIRNSHLMSIAPTGTISATFADNASSGIEPIFAKEQRRTKIMADGSRRDFVLSNAAYRLFRSLRGEDADDSVFQCAEELSVDAHLKMVEAVAPFIDSAISKTINIPVDYPYEKFRGVYEQAYRCGLKGVTTYRPNAMVGTVLADANAKKADELQTEDPDRRITLKHEAIAQTALRWPSRPETPNGIDSHTYSVRHPQGDFAVIVGIHENGRKRPLEVYIAGNEQPRGLAAIAKSLSVDMRTGDAAWLSLKLESLLGTKADDGFMMHDPVSGVLVPMPSLVAGVTKLVKHSLERIGSLDAGDSSMMVDSLFSKREPKTGPQGAIGWHVDIRNDVTGDDFLMHTKEVQLADGTVRPYSVWLSGQYPRVLDGLTKSLSIDMRVSDPGWAMLKLRKLLAFGEQRGDFLAQVPGEAGQQSYPSTVAYMAAVLLHRYASLGLTPFSEVGDGQERASSHVAGGRQCPSCHAMTYVKRSGCWECTNCGATGECG